MHPVLIGYDGTDQGRDALALGTLLARLLEARLEVTTVYPATGRAARSYDEVLRETAEEQLQDARAQLGDAVDASTAVPAASPAHGLHQRAREREAQLLVVGSTHRGRLGRAVAGSVADRLLHGAPCAVAVAPRGYASQQGELGRIVCAYDGTGEARAALRTAQHLARRGHAPLEVVQAAGVGIATSAAWPMYPLPMLPEEEVVQAVERDLADACEDVDEHVRVTHRVLTGEPAQQLRGHAQPDDLVVLGSRGYGPVRSVLLGSVSRAVVEDCPAPVLVVPRPSAEHVDELGRLEATSARPA